MPPQNNQVPPVQPQQPNQNAQQQNSASTQPFSVDSLQKNKKFVETVKTFAIYGAILWVVNEIVLMVLSVLHFSSYYYYGFSIIPLISALIIGAIGFAIGGAIFYFIYEPIKNWIKKTPFLAKYLHNMFDVFWKPFLVCIVIEALFGLLALFSLGAVVAGAVGAYAAASFGTLFIGWLVTLVVRVAVYYWYAKNISAKLTPFYPW